MADTRYIEDELLIHAPTSRVWDALVNPEKTQQYMYGCEVVSDWNVGSPVLWKGAVDGVVYVKGNLVILDEERALAFTLFDPHASYPDVPENYLTATYTLQPEGDTTHLTVTQGDFATVAEGDKRYEDSQAQGGWSAILSAIKELVESETASS